MAGCGRQLESVSVTLDPSSPSEVAAGEKLAVVDESGAGKTIVGRMVTRLIEPDAGTVSFDGVDVLPLPQSCQEPGRVGPAPLSK